MNVLSRKEFNLGAPNTKLGTRGRSLARWLELNHALLAQEFLCVFTFGSDNGEVSIVAVGCEFEVDSELTQDQLLLRLKENGEVKIAASYELERNESFHAQVFGHASAFLKRARQYLVEECGLPPSTLLLGGWRCGTVLEAGAQPLLFTVPRLSFRLQKGECHCEAFGEFPSQSFEAAFAHDTDEAETRHAPNVTSREELPECREYIDSLVELIHELSAAEKDKVVICREVKVTLDRVISPISLLDDVARGRTNQYEFVFRWNGGDAWAGISPETLVKKHGRNVVVEPLAGTRKGSNSSETFGKYRQELISDRKEIEEHETAACMFREHLLRVCIPDTVRLVASRSVLDLGYVQHLKSTLVGEVVEGVGIFDVLSSVYPPATIWGKPIALSGDRIRHYERIERDFFAGGLGFMTLADDANFALVIRSAKLNGCTAHVYAGSGIVKASDPYREWVETTNKMSPFLRSTSLGFRPEPTRSLNVEA